MTSAEWSAALEKEPTGALTLINHATKDRMQVTAGRRFGPGDEWYAVVLVKENTAAGVMTAVSQAWKLIREEEKRRGV